MQYRVELERKVVAVEKAEVFVEAKTVAGARKAAFKAAKELRPSSWEEVDCQSDDPDILLIAEE